MRFTLSQEFWAEFFGTMVLLLFGAGVVAMVQLFGSNPPIPGQIVNGGYTNITLGWGFAVIMGIYIAGTVSGAHLNPAVTIALAATGRFPWAKAPAYIIAQVLGAFLGAAIVFAVYYAKWIQVDPTLSNTAGVFSTFPAVPGFWPGFIDQVVGTALLMALILAIGDKLNNKQGAAFAPLVVGFVVMAIGMSFGGMHGYAINPARDFGPRLFSVLAGFQNNGLTDGSGVWLIPIIGPIVGAILGALAYDLVIGRSLIRAHAKHEEISGTDPTHKETV
ncbi:glycerol uptake facilitator protein [Deinobacterium chartae]|uniref:Glycerol uptake facilitator protein n=1 Tax=Deinobacterium chartae TaxID=521158 RepID=A0A841I2W8_9DEIO|nr:MIP/aquaporin family protein [Deinobacterium chartae]MBB6098382.1 glycerol uptake facilitator protein [Deinobacterium chartae]